MMINSSPAYLVPAQPLNNRQFIPGQSGLIHCIILQTLRLSVDLKNAPS